MLRNLRLPLAAAVLGLGTLAAPASADDPHIDIRIGDFVLTFRPQGSGYRALRIRQLQREIRAQRARLARLAAQERTIRHRIVVLRRARALALNRGQYGYARILGRRLQQQYRALNHVRLSQRNARNRLWRAYRELRFLLSA